MTEDELVTRYPRLWHMAHDGAWPAIREHGLLSATALLDAYGVAGARRHALNSCRRPESVPLKADSRPIAVLRDQKPMTDAKLLQCLDNGLTPTDWYELLNSRSFFWLSRERIWTLLGAKAYRDVRQTVLTLDTKRLVAAHSDRIWLSPINSGSTLFKPQRRGLQTFQRIQAFPFEQRSATRRDAANVVELVVDHSIPDIADFTLAVHSVRNTEVLAEIWRASGATDNDRP